MAALLRFAGPLLLALHGSVFLWTALAAPGDPRFAEAMEGDVAQHVARIAAGQAPYAPASAEFIPLAYHPLHYHLAAPFAEGNPLAAARGVSAAAACWAALCVGLWAARRTASANAGCLAAALFCAALRTCDGALFTALPDSTMLAFALTGWLLLDGPASRAREFAALLCFAAAFWTKQHGALHFAAAAGYAVVFRTNALPRWLWLAFPLALGPGVWMWAGKAWPEFRRFALEVPGGWERAYGASAARAAYMAAVEVPFAGALALTAGWSASRANWRTPSVLAWFVASSLAGNLVTVAAAGSSNNHYIPTVAGLCVLAVVAAQRLAQTPSRLLPWAVALAWSAAAVCTWHSARTHLEHVHVIPESGPWRALAGGAAAWLLLRRTRPAWAWPAAALAAQWGVFLHDPRAYLDTQPAAARQALRQLAEDFRGADVAWIDYGSAPQPELAGFRRFPSWVALEDVSRGKGQTSAPDLEPFRQTLRERPPAVLLCWDNTLAGAPGWRDFAARYGPPEDLGERYAALRQGATHWYADTIFPRYVFRLLPTPVSADRLDR